MVKKLLPIILVLVFFPLTAKAAILFSDLDLSADNQLLFRAAANDGDAAESPSSQDALFLIRLPARGETVAGGEGGGRGLAYTLSQLTAFPEKIELLDSGRTLQIRNAFGAVRVPGSGGLPAPVPGLPSFAGGNPGVNDRAGEMMSSGDGRWLLYLEPVSAALGNLVMLNVLTGQKIPVASRLERPEKQFPASWSPDSRFFVYERDGKLYYYTPAGIYSDSPNTVMDEKLRLIGEGKINSISWSGSGDFYYLRGSALYQVRGTELFTRSLYVDFLEIGTVRGKIPFEFDPSFDNFWIAPDARSMLVSRGQRSLFYFPLPGANTGSAETVLPYLLLPRSCIDINVFWPAGGDATVFAVSGSGLKIWRLVSRDTGTAFESLQPGIGAAGAGTFPAGSYPSGSLSPDGNLILLWGPGGILLYDYARWKLIQVLSERPGVACVWAGNDEFVIGDDRKIERVRLTVTPGSSVFPGNAVQPNAALVQPREAAAPPVQAAVSGRDTVCLSRVDGACFEEKSFRVLAQSGEVWYVTDGRSPWTKIDSPAPRLPSLVSDQYRVYLENQGTGLYSNLPMIRNTLLSGAFSLFPAGTRSGGAQGYDSAGRPMKAALCFDLYDDDQGLPEVLNALRRYGVKATFFLNGEFIRRHPKAAAEIAAEGHEAASMFFALIDLSDKRYRTGDDFISRGLARNEDEFFNVTGKELALLWHPPWYMVSPDIAASAAKAGYTTGYRDIDPLDWVSRDDEKRLGLSQKSPAEMVDSIVDSVKPLSVIPIRLGLLPGGRNDYLFNRINVLIEALIQENYTLTTVSALGKFILGND